MDTQTIVSVIGLLGIGGIVGGYVQQRLIQKRETELKIQNLNEGKYRSTLVFMRCVLNPENLNQFHIEDPNIQKLKEDKKIREYARKKLIEFYYNSLLYASDDVLTKMKKFLESPTEANFMETAVAMRKDLWKKGTKLKLETLSLNSNFPNP